MAVCSLPALPKCLPNEEEEMLHFIVSWISEFKKVKIMSENFLNVDQVLFIPVMSKGRINCIS